ncbi:MAG: hypothetical protein IPJ13_26345 [Saprospiraceae bacterium]|nr:hypothetical protein [Saprospiraceae bacterium]
MFRKRFEALNKFYMKDIFKFESEFNSLKTIKEELVKILDKKQIEKKELYNNLWNDYKLTNYNQ